MKNTLNGLMKEWTTLNKITELTDSERGRILLEARELEKADTHEEMKALLLEFKMPDGVSIKYSKAMELIGFHKARQSEFADDLPTLLSHYKALRGSTPEARAFNYAQVEVITQSIKGTEAKEYDITAFNGSKTTRLDGVGSYDEIRAAGEVIREANKVRHIKSVEEGRQSARDYAERHKEEIAFHDTYQRVQAQVEEEQELSRPNGGDGDKAIESLGNIDRRDWKKFLKTVAKQNSEDPEMMKTLSNIRMAMEEVMRANEFQSKISTWDDKITEEVERRVLELPKGAEIVAWNRIDEVTHEANMERFKQKA